MKLWKKAFYKASSAAVIINIFNDIQTKVGYFGRNMVVYDKEIIRKLKERNKMVNNTVYIKPKGLFVFYWRILNSALLIYNATATPFRVAFHTTETSDALFYFELCTDFIFLMDIVVTFMLPY